MQARPKSLPVFVWRYLFEVTLAAECSKGNLRHVSKPDSSAGFTDWLLPAFGTKKNKIKLTLLSKFFEQNFILLTLDRITLQQNIMGSKACVHGFQVTVGMLVAQAGSGLSIEDILADYPYLEREDI